MRWSRPSVTCRASKALPTSPKAGRSIPRTGEKTRLVVDLSRMSVIKRLPTEEKPDGIAYAAPFHKAYVSNERAKAESVIDVRTDTIVKVLRFDSETGVPQYDPVARKVYVNLQDRNTLVVIDPATDTVV